MEEIDHNKQYSLRWEKHAFNLASEAGCFFEDESFLDCTLSAEGQCIDAHKIILSASSSYLSKLLKITPDKHPILIFNDIKFDQLKSLVAFIYNGSVSVSEDNIHAFLKAAQSLLIKGLSEETNDDQIMENEKKPSSAPEFRGQHRKSTTSGKMNPRKTEVHSDVSKPYYNNYHSHKKQRQTTAVTKSDGECEESLSKLQEISFTKYIHKNLSSKCHDNIRNEIVENCQLMEEKLKHPVENYVVKNWKHNSVADLNGRHKQNHKNNFLKKIKEEKPSGSSNANIENIERGNGNRDSIEAIRALGHQTNQSKLEEIDERIKKEADLESMMLVEPKQEITEEDVNSEEFDNVQNASNESLTPDADPHYDIRSVSNYYQPPVVDRGVPVPLLMCRTSLSEPDSIEPNWMPQIAGNGKSDQSNSIDVGKTSDLPCRTCSQDLPCPTCTKKYKSRYALNRHILYECGKARKSFSCDECGKKVTRQDTLQKHKLIHLVQHLKKKESEVDDEPPKIKKIC